MILFDLWQGSACVNVFWDNIVWKEFLVKRNLHIVSSAQTVQCVSYFNKIDWQGSKHIFLAKSDIHVLFMCYTQHLYHSSVSYVTCSDWHCFFIISQNRKAAKFLMSPMGNVFETTDLYVIQVLRVFLRRLKHTIQYHNHFDLWKDNLEIIYF